LPQPKPSAFGNLGSLVNQHSQPNVNELWRLVKDMELIKLNLKYHGYELARRLADALPPREGLRPQHVGLGWKPSTQKDLGSDWAAYWCGELKCGVTYHRKVWEWVYLLQVAWEHGMLEPGTKALGFGCGNEPIASYFASRGMDVTVTDLPPAESEGRGWRESNQWTESLETAYAPHLVTREQFERHVSLRHVDMNRIPNDLRGYDLCWSVCAFEHLGSIAHGLAFVENAMATLRPGGIAVHTTEFNFLDNRNTIDNWPTVLFQRAHFELLARRLRERGHEVFSLDFDVGDEPLDKFIDLPPFDSKWPTKQPNLHLKLAIDGFACTCYGLVVKKRAD
jgi:hypothetical protein